MTHERPSWRPGPVDWISWVSFLVAVALFVVFAIASCANGETLPVIDFSQEPYAHSTMTWQGQSTQHSGRYVVPRGGHQWGAYVVNADTGLFKMISPVGKVSPLFQPAKYTITGDCWASSKGVAVTPFAPKWVVVWGARSFCSKRCGNVPCEPRQFPDEIQVMRLDAPGFRFVGSVRAMGTGSSQAVVVDGDWAYVQQNLTGIPPIPKWTKIDLNALTVVATDLLVAPAKVYQTSIDGFTYSIAGVFPSPVPQPWPGFQRFRLTRSDTVIPTVPAPTAGAQTQVPTSITTRTRTRTPTRGVVPCDTVPGGPICTPTRTKIPTRTQTPGITRTVLPVVTGTTTATAATVVPTSFITATAVRTPVATTFTATRVPTKPSSGGCGNRGGSVVAGLAVAGTLLTLKRRS